MNRHRHKAIRPNLAADPLPQTFCRHHPEQVCRLRMTVVFEVHHNFPCRFVIGDKAAALGEHADFIGAVVAEPGAVCS